MASHVNLPPLMPNEPRATSSRSSRPARLAPSKKAQRKGQGHGSCTLNACVRWSLLCALPCWFIVTFLHLGAVCYSPDLSFYSDYGPSYLGSKATDNLGFEWAPITDRDTIRCRNLEMLKVWKRQALPLSKDEAALWTSLACDARLASAHKVQTPKPYTLHPHPTP